MMRMPVTVEARFQDGSVQRQQTDRLAEVDDLTFRAKSPLKEVLLEPDSAVVLVEVPSDRQQMLTAKIREMPWTGVGKAALDVYQQAREVKIEDLQVWFKVGMLLYDSRYYEQALDVMTQLGQGDSDWRFGALVWQGHLLDLMGRRADALTRYEEALKVPGSQKMTQDQYHLVIDKKWVEERLNTPFERE